MGRSWIRLNSGNLVLGLCFYNCFRIMNVSRVMRVAINQVKNVRYASSGPAAMTTEYKAPLDAPSPPVNRGWNPSYKARVETAEATKIADEALIHETLAMQNGLFIYFLEDLT